MRGRLLTILGLALTLVLAGRSAAQYMYLDANGDGINTSADILTSGSTGVDIWLRTNANADSSTAVCNSSGAALTINSYEYFLRATGTLVYGAWTDNMGFTSNFGDFQNTTDAYHGRGSGTILAPGTYKLGRLALSEVADGATLSIIAGSPVNPPGFTSFGSACEGNDLDNTCKLGSDWFDVGGTEFAPSLTAPASIQSQEGDLIEIEASVHGSPNGPPPTVDAQGYPGSIALTVIPNGIGAARAVLSGRLGSHDAGTYTVVWSASQGASITTSDTTVVNIIDANFPPEIYAPSSTAGLEGIEISVRVFVEDPDGDAIDILEANTSSLPAGHNATFTVSEPQREEGTLVWTPDYRSAGQYGIVFVATARGMSSSVTTWITVQNEPNPPPWATRSVRVQLPGPGYRLNVSWFDGLCAATGGLCRQETLAAGDSGQVYISVRQSTDPEQDAPLYDMIHLEFPAQTGSAYFTVPSSQANPFSYFWRDPLFLGHPVEWHPSEELPPYNYDFVPTNNSDSYVRLLNICDRIKRMWVETYGIDITPEEIVLWDDLDVASFTHWAFPVFNYIRWFSDIDRHKNSPAREAHILAHEFTHVYQFREIYAEDSYPGAGGGHRICDSDDEQRSWAEGTAEGIAEYFIVSVMGLGLGTNRNAGDGPCLEAATNEWTCNNYGLSVEATNAFYVYLMNRQNPRAFIDCLRFATYDIPLIGVRHAQTMSAFRDLWSDRPPPGTTIAVHRPGGFSDSSAYLAGMHLSRQSVCAPPTVTSVETKSPPLDVYGSVRKVFPLPTAGAIKVEALGPGTGEAYIRIVQPNGRVVREFKFSGLAPGQYSILDADLSGLPSGVYLLWYSDSTDGGIKAGRKVVVAK